MCVGAYVRARARLRRSSFLLGGGFFLCRASVQFDVFSLVLVSKIHFGFILLAAQFEHFLFVFEAPLLSLDFHLIFLSLTFDDEEKLGVGLGSSQAAKVVWFVDTGILACDGLVLFDGNGTNLGSLQHGLGVCLDDGIQAYLHLRYIVAGDATFARLILKSIHAARTLYRVDFAFSTPQTNFVLFCHGMRQPCVNTSHLIDDEYNNCACKEEEGDGDEPNEEPVDE